MDLDILHIRLTAYALDELDAAQKAEVEHVLTESQDARDHVARAKNIAKAIKDLLPQTAEDIHPMTPGEYHLHKKGQHPGGLAQEAFVPSTGNTPQAETNTAPTEPANNGLVWILATCCVLLAVAWLWQANSTPKPTPKNAVTESAYQAMEAKLKDANQAAQAAKEALKQEREAQAPREEALTKAQQDADGAQTRMEALEEDKQKLEITQAQLEFALAHTQSLADALQRPFVSATGQTLLHFQAAVGNQSLKTLSDALENGRLPLPDQVDTGDLVQSLKYNYTAPPLGQKLPMLDCAIASCPWNEAHHLARITLVAGTFDATLSALQIDFNPTTVARWREIGREAKLADGTAVAAFGTGTLSAGASLTLLVEIEPSADPLAPLLAKRVALTQKIEAATTQVAAGGDAVTLAEAKLNQEGLRLDLQDLEAQITKATASQAAKGRYLQSTAPSAASASGDWLTASASFAQAPEGSGPTQATLAGQVRAFTDTDADFRLACAGAALGLVMHESPNRGTANLGLVANLLKDLPQSQESVKTLTELTQKAAAISQ